MVSISAIAYQSSLLVMASLIIMIWGSSAIETGVCGHVSFTDPTVRAKCTRKNTPIITLITRTGKITIEFSYQLNISFLLMLFLLYNFFDLSHTKTHERRI